MSSAKVELKLTARASSVIFFQRMVTSPAKLAIIHSTARTPNLRTLGGTPTPHLLFPMGNPTLEFGEWKKKSVATIVDPIWAMYFLTGAVENDNESTASVSFTITRQMHPYLILLKVRKVWEYFPHRTRCTPLQLVEGQDSLGQIRAQRVRTVLLKLDCGPYFCVNDDYTGGGHPLVWFDSTDAGLFQATTSASKWNDKKSMLSAILAVETHSRRERTRGKR